MCPTAISMNTYVLRIHILTDIVNLCGKSVLTRHPDTGLALCPSANPVCGDQEVRYQHSKWFKEMMLVANTSTQKPTVLQESN